MPTLEEAQVKNLVEKWLEYRPDTGEFWWIVTGGGIDNTKPAGTITNQGRRIIRLGIRRYLAHRLVWLLHYGVWPVQEIDHIDRNPLNNRLANLRDISHSANLWNSKTRTDNTSGVRGVCWDKQKGKWKVQVGPPHARVQKHFVLLEDAKAYALDVTSRISGARA